ncbi:Peptide chain release factor 2 [bacterium AB1]|nr:Peptide chain release factor 2 [bacterium AB1]
MTLLKKIKLQIICGNGGKDTEDLSNSFFKLYLNFFKNNNFNIISYNLVEKSILFSTQYYQYYIDNENIIYKIIRISPFCGKKQTSFLKTLFQIHQVETKYTLNKKDIIIEAKHSTGAGGQHANKTKSAVKITHKIFNISIEIEETRSFVQNLKIAIKKMEEKIQKIKLDRDNNKKNNSYKEANKISWSHFDRLINLHQNKYISLYVENKIIKYHIKNISEIPLDKIMNYKQNNKENGAF